MRSYLLQMRADAGPSHRHETVCGRMALCEYISRDLTYANVSLSAGVTFGTSWETQIVNSVVSHAVT